MTPGQALIALTSRGVSVTVEGYRLFVDPVSALTDDERAALRAEKPHVVAFLRRLNESDGANEQTGADLLDEAERLGASLYLRPQGDVGIRDGACIPDALLLRLARAHNRILETIRSSAPKMNDDGMPLLDYAGEKLGFYSGPGWRDGLTIAAEIPQLCLAA